MYIYSDVMKTIQFMTSLYMYYALCFAHVEHSVCHEPISVLININMYIYIYLIYLEPPVLFNFYVHSLFLVNIPQALYVNPSCPKCISDTNLSRED